MHNHTGKRSELLIPPKTRNCPFGCGQKSAINQASVYNPPHPPPQTGNAHIHGALFKKGYPLPFVKYSMSVAKHYILLLGTLSFRHTPFFRWKDGDERVEGLGVGLNPPQSDPEDFPCFWTGHTITPQINPHPRFWLKRTLFLKDIKYLVPTFSWGKKIVKQKFSWNLPKQLTRPCNYANPVQCRVANFLFNHFRPKEFYFKKIQENQDFFEALYKTHLIICFCLQGEINAPKYRKQIQRNPNEPTQKEHVKYFRRMKTDNYFQNCSILLVFQN